MMQHPWIVVGVGCATFFAICVLYVIVDLASHDDEE